MCSINGMGDVGRPFYIGRLIVVTSVVDNSPWDWVMANGEGQLASYCISLDDSHVA